MLIQLLAFSLLLSARASEPPAFSTAPAAAVAPSTSTAKTLDEAEADRRLRELYDSVRTGRFVVHAPRQTTSEFLASVSFDLGETQWYTLDLTRSQWSRWHQKSLAWKEDAHLRRLYDNDIEKFSGKISGTQIAAMLDALIVQIHKSYPNRVTGLAIDGMRAYERIRREIPIEFRDDLRDRFDNWVDARRAREDPFVDELEGAPSSHPGVRLDEAIDERAKCTGEFLRAVNALEPRLNLKASPRLDPKDPSAKLGAGLSLQLSERWRFKLEGDYDTRSYERGCRFGLGCSF